MPGRSRRSLLVVLLAAAVCPYFLNLGVSSIWDANEAFYVETPREMIERGDYISPTFNYQPRFNKPVLSYWIVAGWYKVFGVSVGVQRVPIAIGAMVLIMTAFVLARMAGSALPPRTGPASSARFDEAPLWAALGLAISPRLLMFARRIFIDIYVSLFMALTLMFFALAERDTRRRRVWLVLMYGSIGLGVLTKGPVAAVLPALAFGVYLLIHRDLKRLWSMMLPVGFLIVLAIVIPWYAALYRRYGWTYISSFFISENLGRYTEGVGFDQDRGPLWYLPVVFSDSFPWSMFLVAAAVLWVRYWRSRPAVSTPSLRTQTLLWIWIAVIVGFFSFSAAKQDLYVFPIVPAIAALGGIAVARALEPDSERSTVLVIRWTLIVSGLLLAAAGVGLVYLFYGAGAVYKLEGVWVIGAVAMAGGLAVSALAARSRVGDAVTTLAVVFVIANWSFVLRTLPSFEAYKPAPPIAAILRSRVAPDEMIATYNVALPSLVFYLGRHTDVFYDSGPLVQLFGSGRPVHLVIPEDDFTELQPRLPVPTCVVARAPTFDAKLKNMLAREPLPELLVVTTRCGG